MTPLLRRHWVRRRIYHIYQRSSRQQILFSCVREYREYVDRLFSLARRYRVRIHAYCLLPREVRLLAEPLDEWSISDLMQQLQSGYARWLHERLDTDGHLWKHKFGAVHVPAADFRTAV
jgi:putative transposase